MRPWSQITSLILGIAGLVVALIPRHYTPEFSGVNNFRLIPWPSSTTASSKATTAGWRPSPRISCQESAGDLAFVVCISGTGITVRLPMGRSEEDSRIKLNLN